MTKPPLSHEEAISLDEKDPLSKLREQFEIPFDANGNEQAYFAGNSLGLLPRRSRLAMQDAIDQWGKKGVLGHFDGSEPWYVYDEIVSALQTEIVGCLPTETGVMGTLTSNLHALMASFYRPQGKRNKILIEPHAFPSDRYAVAAQVAWHGGNPRSDIVVIQPENSDEVTPTDLERTLHEHGDSVCLALIGGLNYYTGQFIDIPKFASLLQDKEIIFGLDLAHAVGNVPLELHNWDIDFAAWCTYKYLNGGPGSISGYFVNQRHHADKQLVRLAGWWGNDPETRFDMHGQETFTPRESADGWKASNPSLFAMVPVKTSLEIFNEVGIEALRERSIRLTSYFEQGIDAIGNVSSITPRDPQRRGCQISVRVPGDASQLEHQLIGKGVVPDARDPDVLRFAPTPLYTTFADVARAVEDLSDLVSNLK
ncbi:MAG: kynureninase [Acidimicrobiales bacterium]|jgi:kynureninase|nr:kynureninase [Acidimicrobiales bacterium]